MFLSVIAVILVSCKKKADDTCNAQAGTTVAPANEELLVTNYLSSNNITTATELEGSGMYYIIDAAGNGTKPNQCKTLSVKYKGYRQNNEIFDQTTGSGTVSFVLANLIEGWRRGLPLLSAGGKIRLFVPPSLHYGPNGLQNPNTGTIIIPANQMIWFDIELVAVQ
jgi:FKBP-type peptidyl-prolyl cis-trans isomerase FkpA